jgi:hypothetical protein
LKCPQCGFGGNEDAYEKIEDEGPKEI